ncbi:hypothetical protein C8R45DRAFT_946940 [Mycena sanguinolenta]|nr:hypothetical protein C8R45DRAFT_946940 [Mycena sanguinolenta]
MAPKATQPKASSKKGKLKVNFGANGTSRKRKPSPANDPDTPGSTKRARTNGASGSTSAGGSTSTRTTDTGAAASANTSGTAVGTTAADTNNSATDKTPAKKGVRNPWGIRPTELPENAKLTQRAFQRFIRAISGLLTQTDVLPSAIETQKHYDRCSDNVDDVREHMYTLVDKSRTAVSAAKDLATKLKQDAVRISGPIANDIAHIPETHLASIFTMILKAGLRGFLSGFQFISASLALGALEVNAKVAEDTELLGDMYDNYVYGTLAQKTKMDCCCPGSLSQSITHGVEFKARARLGEVHFKTAVSLQLRKPVLRMVCIAEAHSYDEHSSSESCVREKPGRNPIVAQFFREELDPEAEDYRKGNMKKCQREPKTRIRTKPLLQASLMGTVLPDDVPIDFFTPEFFNSLTLKERARYIHTGVAFPVADFAFDEAHNDWKTMGKKEFMEMYGNNVLNLYDIPTPEKIEAIPVSDADDPDEEEEINLEDTDDEADEVQEMVVDEE